MNEHPTKESLLALLAGELGENESSEISQHVDSCTACQMTLAALADVDETMALKKRQPKTPPAPSAHFLHQLKQSLQSSDIPGKGLLGHMHGMESTAARQRGGQAPSSIRDSQSDIRSNDNLQMPAKAGRFEIGEEIARGGMGAIFRAYDPDFDRTLAVKVMLHSPKERPDLERRFWEEARITGQLQHPGLAPVHDRGRLVDGRAFFAMKLIDGRTLAELLKLRDRVDQDLPRFLSIFEQICQTIAYAHSRYVIHRDLKPANVMVGVFGEVQVMDWGLAKRIGGRNSEMGMGNSEVGGGSIVGTFVPDEVAPYNAGSAPGGDEATEVGSVLGTLSYMAPEQARGEIGQLDERCDVFSLGAILCVILTEKHAFEAESTTELLELASQGDLSKTIKALDRCGADADLVHLAKSCLSPLREDRPRNAGAVAEAIAAYRVEMQEKLRRTELERAAERAKTAEERKKRRWMLLSAAAALLLIAVLVAAGFWRQHDLAQRQIEEAKQQTEFTAEVSRGIALATDQRVRALEFLLDAKRETQPQQTAHMLSAALFKHKHTLDGAQDTLAKIKRTIARQGRKLTRDLHLSLQQELRNQQLAEKDFQLLHAFELYRWNLAKVDVENNHFQSTTAFHTLRKALQRYGLEFGKIPPGEVQKRLSGRPAIVRQTVIDMLYVALMDLHYSNKQEFGWLNQALDRADPKDGWRRQVRQALAKSENAALLHLIQQKELDGQSPTFLNALGSALPRSIRFNLLQRGRERNPKDFWLTLSLAAFLAESASDFGGEPFANPTAALQESLRYYTAAMALHPDNEGVCLNVGHVLDALGRPEEAVTAFRKAIAINPKYAMAYNNLGKALGQVDDLQGAVAAFERALALRPNDSMILVNFGVALKTRKDLDGAVAAFQKAISCDGKCILAYYSLGGAMMEKEEYAKADGHFRTAIELKNNYAEAHCNLGHSLKRQGRFSEALSCLQRGHEIGSRRPGWQYPSEKWIKECERLISLDNRLQVILEGGFQPKDAGERLALADMCRKYKDYYLTAVRFFREAFAEKSNAAHTLRFRAARAAARAAAGQSKEKTKIDHDERRQLRRQALRWLQAGMDTWRYKMPKDSPLKMALLADELPRWQMHPDLASIRDETELRNLPESEQQLCRNFWSDVKALLKLVNAHITLTNLKGRLTKSATERVHSVSLRTDRMYVFSLESKQFDTLLRLEDGLARVIASNDDVHPKNWNSLLVIRPHQEGMYRLVATSFQHRGRGTYKLRMFEYNKNAIDRN